MQSWQGSLYTIRQPLLESNHMCYWPQVNCISTSETRTRSEEVSMSFFYLLEDYYSKPILVQKAYNYFAQLFWLGILQSVIFI